MHKVWDMVGFLEKNYTISKIYSRTVGILYKDISNVRFTKIRPLRQKALGRHMRQCRGWILTFGSIFGSFYNFFKANFSPPRYWITAVSKEHSKYTLRLGLLTSSSSRKSPDGIYPPNYTGLIRILHRTSYNTLNDLLLKMVQKPTAFH